MKLTAKLFSLMGLLIVAIIVVGNLVGGWVIMLLLGGLHHSVYAPIPALSYWPCVLIYFAFAFVSGFFRGGIAK